MQRSIALRAGLFLAVAIRINAAAGTYHVGQDLPGASDENPGTRTAPWRTISHAATQVNAGDTVWIHAGRYPESVRIERSGAADAPIVFAAYADDDVMLDGSDEIPPQRWQPVEGFSHLIAIPLTRDPAWPMRRIRTKS